MTGVISSLTSKLALFILAILIAGCAQLNERKFSSSVEQAAYLATFWEPLAVQRDGKEWQFSPSSVVFTGGIPATTVKLIASAPIPGSFVRQNWQYEIDCNENTFYVVGTAASTSSIARIFKNDIPKGSMADVMKQRFCGLKLRNQRTSLFLQRTKAGIERWAVFEDIQYGENGDIRLMMFEGGHSDKKRDGFFEVVVSCQRDTLFRNRGMNNWKSWDGAPAVRYLCEKIAPHVSSLNTFTEATSNPTPVPPADSSEFDQLIELMKPSR
jgi:hypothetical protein